MTLASRGLKVKVKDKLESCVFHLVSEKDGDQVKVTRSSSNVKIIGQGHHSQRSLSAKDVKHQGQESKSLLGVHRLWL